MSRRFGSWFGGDQPRVERLRFLLSESEYHFGLIKTVEPHVTGLLGSLGRLLVPLEGFKRITNRFRFRCIYSFTL